MENTQQTITIKSQNGEKTTKLINVPSPPPNQTPIQQAEKKSEKTPDTKKTEKTDKTKKTTKTNHKRQSATEFLAIGIERIHTLIALKTECEALRIDQIEAGMVAQAIDNVLAQFEVEVNPKTETFMTLAATLFMVYAPKVKAYREHTVKK